MKLSLKMYKEVKENSIQNIDNQLLTELLLIIANKNQTILKYFFEQSFNSNKELFDKYLSVLLDKNFLSKKDMEFVLKSLKVKIKENNSEEYNEDLIIENIISHLSVLTNKKYRVTNTRKSLIIKWLKKGYSISDFYNVHVYYFLQWGNNPDFSIYLRPETLYNNKFEVRVEESNLFFTQIKEFEECIKQIIDLYNQTYRKFINSDNVLLLQNKIEKELSSDHDLTYLSLAKFIVFWLKKNYDCKTIADVVCVSIESWSKKQELIPYISLEKILDEKFPQRVIALKKQYNNQDKNIGALNNWLKNKKSKKK